MNTYKLEDICVVTKNCHPKGPKERKVTRRYLYHKFLWKNPSNHHHLLRWKSGSYSMLKHALRAIVHQNWVKIAAKPYVGVSRSDVTSSSLSQLEDQPTWNMEKIWWRQYFSHKNTIPFVSNKAALVRICNNRNARVNVPSWNSLDHIAYQRSSNTSSLFIKAQLSNIITSTVFIRKSTLKLISPFADAYI